jgi:ABC-type transport system involved in cytochrome bd biosynthesis fused ATPase/permease subunit
VEGKGDGSPGILAREVSRRAVREWLVLAISAGIVGSVAAAGQAIAIGVLLASLFSPDRLPGYGMTLLIITTVVRAVAAPLVTASGARAAGIVRSRLRQEGLEQAIGKNSSSGGRGEVAEAAVVIGHNLDAIDVYVGRYLPSKILAAAAPAVLLTAIAILDWLSFLILVVALAVMVLFLVLVGLLTREKVASRMEALTRLGNHFLDVVEGLPLLRSYGLAKRQEARIEAVSENLRLATMAVLKQTLLSSLVLEVAASIGTALVAVPLALRLIDGRMDLSIALAVLILVPQVFGPIRQASAEFHAASDGLASAEALDRLIDRPTSCKSGQRMPGGRADEALVVPQAPLLSVKGLEVKYSSREETAVGPLDLEVGRGELLAITGPSGSGKSTLVKAIAGLLPVSAGTIELSGLPVDPDGDRGSIAYVAQHPWFYPGTVVENLTLGLEGDEIGPGFIDTAKQLLHDLGLDEALSKIGGIWMAIGPNGERLSAGERQRLAVARALVRLKANLLLLDEPTANLDEHSEALVFDTLDRWLGGRSLIMVTHSPKGLAMSNSVLVLTEGKPVVQYQARTVSEAKYLIADTGERL